MLVVLKIVTADEAKEVEGNDEIHLIRNEALDETAPELPAVSTIKKTQTELTKPAKVEFLAEQFKDLLCWQLASPSEHWVTIIPTIALDLWFASLPSMQRYRISFQDRYMRPFHTPITTCNQSDSLQNTGCMIQCGGRYTGLTWPTPHSQALPIAVHAHDLERKNANSIPETVPIQQPARVYRQDLIGLLPKTTNRKEFLVIMTNRYSQLTREMLTSNKCAMHIKFISHDHWIVPYRIYASQLTENGTQLVTKFFKTIWNFLGLKHIAIVAFKPRPMDKQNIL